MNACDLSLQNRFILTLTIFVKKKVSEQNSNARQVACVGCSPRARTNLKPFSVFAGPRCWQSPTHANTH